MRLKGFTLIELLIVIAIIGVLISVSVVGWVSVAQRGRDSTRKSDLARIKQALQQEYSDTRLYPAFDFDGTNLIYAASWQLTTSTTCQHTNTATRLTTKYLPDIPHDPLDNPEKYTQQCSGLTTGQTNRYLYISSPIDTDLNKPAANATGFALMATLEQGTNERIADPKLNPLDTQYTGATFGSWYSSKHNYDNPIGVNANYLVDSTNH